MTQLWLVGERVYVISDGPAGAVYLANESNSDVGLNEDARLLKRDIESKFKPRVISRELARQLLTAVPNLEEEDGE